MNSAAYHQTVLLGRVLVLGLGDQALASIVVGLSFPPALVLGLEAAALALETEN